MASPSWNAGYAVMAVVEAEGFYEEEGLKVTTNLFPSATQAAQQVAAGGADLGLMTVEPVAIGRDKGLNLAYFSSYWEKWIYSLEVPAGSSVKSIADLKGKKIGVSAVASSGATFARTAMKLNGMSENDVTLVPIGAGAQQINAIKGGQVDALALWDIQYQLVRNAGVTLTPLPVKETADAWGGGFATTRKNLDAKKDVLQRFGRAVMKAFVFAKANPEAAIRDLWKLHPETRGSEPEAKALADGIKVLEVRLAGQGFDDKTLGSIDEAAFTRSLDFLASAGLIKKFPAKDIYTDEMFKAFNDFSHEDVIKRAESAG
ncbi:ABC transporter substrate-binding protein [Pseudosporangium ferrugineum]|nr:ABC transporter substrate-binding protein [Pseudosporangium ferrugineum]